LTLVLSLVSGTGWRQRRLTLACGERDERRTGPLLTEETMAKKGEEKVLSSIPLTFIGD